METTGNTTDQDYTASESSSDWLFDAFSEPRTFPSQWDLTDLMLAENTARQYGSTPPTPNREFKDGPVEYKETGAPLHYSYLNPFPEPRTYPLYWDLCW